MKSRVVLLACCLATLSFGAFAQGADAPVPKVGTHDGRAPAMPSPSDMAAFNDARIAGMKAGLNLKPDQEAAWATFEKGYRARLEEEQDGERKMLAMRSDGGSKGAPESLLENLERMASSYGQAAKSAKSFAESLQPLFEALSPDQRSRINLLYMYSENGPGMPQHQWGGQERKRMAPKSPQSDE